MGGGNGADEMKLGVVDLLFVFFLKKRSLNILGLKEIF